MAEKNINSRIQHKHDVEENWKKAVNFTPKDGEMIVYDVDATHNKCRIKFGNGVDNVNDLPFVDEPITLDEIDAICGQTIASVSEVSW